MRKAHRYLAVVVVFLGLYIALTGLAIQTLDIGALLRHAPPADPTMRSMRAGLYGPPNFQVIGERDFGAPPLPARFDYDTALATAAHSARAATGGAALGFVEFRMLGGRPVVEVASGRQELTFESATGATALAPRPLVLPTMDAPGLRNTLKGIHRFRIYGGWFVLVDIAAGLLVMSMIVTGGVMWWKLWKQRRRTKRPNPFWKAGGWWRTLHRGTAVAAAAFLLIVAFTGTVLSISSIGVVISVARHGGKRPVITADFSKRLTDAELPVMLHATLAGERATRPGEAIRALRLRYFAGMPQGVVVTGGREADQRVYRATDGREVSLTEPEYPAPGQTFGWQADETFKKIHRGDYFGLTGRVMSVLTGLALLYLSVSGAMIYRELWKLRRKRGRHGLFWSP